MRKITLSLLLAVLCALSAAAQSYTISIHLEDSTTGESVAFATVSLTPEGATKATKYMLTDSKGNGALERVRAGSYEIKAELMGYKAHTQTVKVEDKNIDLGTVKMEPDQEVLDAAKVSAVGNPIVIKKDTVEYNASSFKTTDNDALEELLKKLPGVEVAEDGTITSNGETITKITIDGKTFFLDDPQLASKNLPAKIVDKVKVVKKKSEQAEFTGIDDGNEEYVIDLTVKRGMMNGVFGNVMAGGGHDVPSDANGLNDYRYQGAAMVAKFTEKSQLSLILNANNTNNRGFNDLSGSMMQSMRGGGGGMGRGQGGWGGGNGITTSYMGGVNGAWTLFDGKMDFGGNYLYNNTNRDVLEESYKEVYRENAPTLIYNTNGSNHTASDGHRLGFRLDHKFSENTSILIQPQIDFGRGSFLEFQDFTTDSRSGNVTSHVNQGFSSTSGQNRNLTTRGFALFRQRLGIPGRTISIMSNWNYSNNDIDGYNQSLTDVFSGQAVESSSIINQRYDRNSKNRSVMARAVYTEPLGNDFYLEGNYSYSWRKNTSEKTTWDGVIPSPFTRDSHVYDPNLGETVNLAYTNHIINLSHAQSAGLNLAYQHEKTRAQVGVSVNPTKTHNTTTEGETERTYDNKVVNWAPRAMVFHDLNDNTEFRLFYMGRSEQPSTSQLMATLDNSNPLNLSFGNPSLTPYFNHDLRSELNYSNRKTFFSLRGTLEGGMVESPIVNATWTDKSGVTYAMPVNGDNRYNASLRLFLNAPIARSNFSVSFMTRTSYSETNNFVGKGNDFNMDPYYNPDGTVKYDEFVAAFSDIRSRKDFIHNKTRTLSTMDRLRVTYRSDNLEITASGRTRVSKPWYTVMTDNTNDNATWNNQIQSTFNWTVGETGLVIKSDYSYNWYNGYTTQLSPEHILNAEISQLLFKKQFTLALRGYDILNQTKNLSVSDTDNYHQETWNNTLGRYIILSLTWRFGNFGNARNGRMGGMGPGMGGPGGYRGGGGYGGGRGR